jgi:hypothetical protein
VQNGTVLQCNGADKAFLIDKLLDLTPPIGIRKKIAGSIQENFILFADQISDQLRQHFCVKQETTRKFVVGFVKKIEQADWSFDRFVRQCIERLRGRAMGVAHKRTPEDFHIRSRVVQQGTNRFMACKYSSKTPDVNAVSCPFQCGTKDQPGRMIEARATDIAQETQHQVDIFGIDNLSRFDAIGNQPEDRQALEDHLMIVRNWSDPFHGILTRLFGKKVGAQSIRT